MTTVIEIIRKLESARDRNQFAQIMRGLEVGNRNNPESLQYLASFRNIANTCARRRGGVSKKTMKRRWFNG